MSLFGILIMPFKLRRVLPIAKPLENRSSSDTGEPLCYRIDMRYSNTIAYPVSNPSMLSAVAKGDEDHEGC